MAGSTREEAYHPSPPRFPGENNKAGFRSSSFGGITSLVTRCVGCWADRIAHHDTSVSAVPASGRKDNYYEGENRSGPNRRFCLRLIVQELSET